MFNRLCFGALLFAGLAGTFTGCGTALVDSITVTPNTLNFTGTGGTAQMTAIGTYGHGSNHPSTTQDITDLVTWASDGPEVATVSATGLVTAVGAGTVQITASMNGFTGLISATATATVTIPNSGGGGGSNSSYASLAIIPGSQSVASPTETSQFIAIGTTTAGGTVDLTHSVLWGSSSAQVATITQAGLATGVSQGTTTITAIATNPGGTVVAGTATFTVTGGASEAITALSITPNAESLSASGQTGQLIAIGTQGSTGLQIDVTNNSNLTWVSSIPTIASVSSGLSSGSGIVTGASAGTTTVTAEYSNGATVVTPPTPTTITVTNTASPSPLLSLAIIPSNGITVGNLQDTGNFLAIGTFSVAPYVRDLTNTATWLSSAPNVFPVSSNNGSVNPGAPGGIVTAYGDGNAVIIAETSDGTQTGTIQIATSSFACPLVEPCPASECQPPIAGSCFPGSQANGLLVTLNVYNEGLNTTNWLVTAPSATNTPNVLHCGPGWTADGNTGGSVCTATYPIGTTVTLTAPAQTGANFGGWSYNCAPTAAITAAGPNSCTVVLGSGTSSNVTVGAIFN